MQPGVDPGSEENQVNDIVTIRGNVGTDPVRNTTNGGDSVLNFRVASSSGYWDKRAGAYVETGTNWYAVTAFRRLADNAKASLRSGDAVIVTGELQLKEWQNNGRSGFSADIVAESIGHDLARGTSNFMRTPRPSSAPAAAAPTTHEAAPAAPHDSEAPGEAEVADWTAAGLHVIAGTGEIAEDGEEVEQDAYADA